MKTFLLNSIPHRSLFTTFLWFISTWRESWNTSNTWRFINWLMSWIKIGQNTIGISCINERNRILWCLALICALWLSWFILIPLSRISFIITTYYCGLSISFCVCLEFRFTWSTFWIWSIINSTPVWQRQTSTIRIIIFSFVITTNSTGTCSIFCISFLTWSTFTCHCSFITKCLILISAINFSTIRCWYWFASMTIYFRINIFLSYRTTITIQIW